MTSKADEDTPAEHGDQLLQKLLETRTVVICQEINDELTRRVISQLLLLEAADAEQPIQVLINSPGGSADSGFAIFDLLRFIKPPVVTVAIGLVASAASIILLAPKKASRLTLPHARFLLHQPMGGMRGQAADIAIEAEEILKMRRRLNEIFAEQTGQPLEKVEHDTDRNFWMSAKEAVSYGLVGKIIQSTEEVE